MKILLLGKTGQVGWELQRSLAPLAEVVALGRDADKDLCGDLTNLPRLAETVRAVAPDVIVNAAAYTAVDKAEADVETAYTINAQAPGLLANLAEECGAWLVHYSTDYVFAGTRSVPWQEHDTTGPLNVYGQTKLEGERQIAAATERHLIFRTSWVYAARGGNFAKTMLRLAQERDSLNVINDQHGAPTGAELIADVTALAIKAVVSGTRDLGGIYHLVAAGETTWHEYAQFVLQQAEKAGVALKASASTVLPVPTSAFSTPAKRPLNSRLNTEKLTQALGLVMPPWQQGVARMLTEIL